MPIIKLISVLLVAAFLYLVLRAFLPFAGYLAAAALLGLGIAVWLGRVGR